MVFFCAHKLLISLKSQHENVHLFFRYQQRFISKTTWCFFPHFDNCHRKWMLEKNPISKMTQFIKHQKRKWQMTKMKRKYVTATEMEREYVNDAFTTWRQFVVELIGSQKNRIVWISSINKLVHHFKWFI